LNKFLLFHLLPPHVYYFCSLLFHYILSLRAFLLHVSCLYGLVFTALCFQHHAPI
jgi:hypothetical protein